MNETGLPINFRCDYTYDLYIGRIAARHLSSAGLRCWHYED